MERLLSDEVCTASRGACTEAKFSPDGKFGGKTTDVGSPFAYGTGLNVLQSLRRLGRRFCSP